MIIVSQVYLLDCEDRQLFCRGLSMNNPTELEVIAYDLLLSIPPTEIIFTHSALDYLVNDLRLGIKKGRWVHLRDTQTQSN